MWSAVTVRQTSLYDIFQIVDVTIKIFYLQEKAPILTFAP